MAIDDPLTVAQACRAFREQHQASRARLRMIDAMLEKVCAAFGERPVVGLDAASLARWRASMPPPTRWQATQAFKQVTAWAARWKLVAEDPLAGLPNPRPWRAEVRPFDDWAQVDRVMRELPERLALLPILGAGCGLRPGELLGLDWSSIDLDSRVLHVRASVYERELRTTLKTRRSLRSVPLRGRVVEQLATAPGRRESGLVFASSDGRPLDLHDLRARAWRPALRAAGIEHPFRLYDLRHTYATWSLRAGVGIYQLARRMGTSVAMIDATYGHLAADAGDHERALLDAWDER
ncbi:MAG: site-specific integrase [Thermoleophilia bacterium]|nr:site-specific integrase [Thermoleophilia bacterium]